MNTLILLFFGLFAASTIIAVRVVISTRKRRRKANEEEQTRKAEMEAREHKLKTLEQKFAAQTRELEAREASLKRETEVLIREREDVTAIRQELTTEAERIAGASAMINAKEQEHLTKERQLQDIAAELESKSKHIAMFEESLKKTNKELEQKDLKLSVLKEEIDGRASALINEKKRLDEHEAELKALQDKLKYEKEEMEHNIAEIIEDKKNLTEERSALKISQDKLLQFESELEDRSLNIEALEDRIRIQKQELAAKEDALKKESEALIREREDVAAIRQELTTEAERIAGASAMINAKEQEHLAKEKELKDIATELKTRSEQLTASEDRLIKIREDLTSRELKLTASKEEIEVRNAALITEKEELDARDTELKTLQDELKSYKEEIDLKIVSIINDKKNLAEECSALKRTRENLEKQVEQLAAKLQLCEKHRHKAEEERKPLEEGEQQKTKEEEARRRAQEEQERKTDNESQEKAKKEPLPPDKRGGRSRGTSKESAIEKEHETKPRSLKPEIVCWKEGWSWVIGIEVPEELESLCVTQNEELLEQDNIDESRYRLKQADGIMKVTWTEGTKVLSLMEPKRNYLIFKLRKNWKEPGRLVQRSTNGYYLIVAPQEWERDNEISGTAPVNPESTQLEGYRVHFFYKDQKWNNAIGFITANGERIQVESGSPSFQLVGSEINDASEDMGPLFGKEPPLIKVLDDKEWSDVGVIVLGEEGSGRNKWRTQFSPQLAEKEQKLPEKLTSRRGGWYFVRIYDNDYNLIESMDFRFMEGLREIKIHPHSFFPEPSGHQPVRVEFLHKPRCRIQLLAKGDPESLQIKHEDELMSTIIPRHPAWDVTDWEIRCDRAKVIVEIMIERIWWSLTENDSLSSTELLDRTLSIGHDSLNATSNTFILLWFPKPRWIQTILVGFEKSKSRPYSVEVNDRKIRIPLREFCDADEIENQTQQVLLRLWLVDRNTPEDGIVICEILPKKEPTPILPEDPIQPVIEPDQMPCCNTCDHARIHHNIYWCRRYHWPQVSAPEFRKKYERFRCAEWRGEYFNATHKDWRR